MRGLQLSQLTAFAAVARHRSFTRAATQLGVTTPSISATIRTLEEAFGVRLLNRTTRNVALTEAGEQLLCHLNPVLEGVDRAIDAVNTFRSGPAGVLRLVVHPIAVAALAPLIARFSAECPAIHLELCVDGERKDIVGEHFDAGIDVTDSVDKDMVALPAGERLKLVTVAAPAYLARHAPPSVPEDLRLHNCIRYRWTAKASAAPWKFVCGARAVEIAVRGSLTVNDHELALHAALDGIGLVQLPQICVSRFVAEGRLIPLFTELPSPTTGCCLFYSGRRHVPVKLRALVDFFRREAAANARRRERPYPALVPPIPVPAAAIAAFDRRAKVAAELNAM